LGDFFRLVTEANVPLRFLSASKFNILRLNNFVVPKTQTGYFRASVQAEQLEPRLVLSGTVGLTPAELPDSITEQQGSLYAPTEALDSFLLRGAQSEDSQLNESELDTFFSELTEKNTDELLSDDSLSTDTEAHEYRIDLITEDIYLRDSYTDSRYEYNSEYRDYYRQLNTKQNTTHIETSLKTIQTTDNIDTQIIELGEGEANTVRGPPAEGEADSLNLGGFTITGADVNNFQKTTHASTNVDTNGDGTADLLNATLEAWTYEIGSSVSILMPDSSEFNLVGSFTLASVTPNGITDARYTAMKMGDVVITTTDNALLRVVIICTCE